jgi:predicted amidohydrolase YtcJ
MGFMGRLPRTVKVFHGLSLSGRTARLYQPYADRPDYFGLEPQRSQEQLNLLVREIHEAGFQAALHCNGDYEIDMVLDAIEHAVGDGEMDHRHRIAHGTVVNPEILARMRDLRVVLVPHSYIFEKGPMLEAYGEHRWDWMIPNASSFEYGIPNAGNSDFPVSAAEPLLRIQSLVTRRSRQGKVYGPSQRLSVEQALHVFTMGGAYASFEENQKGSISEGKFADFVVLSQDPRAVPPDSIARIQVEQTFVAGVKRFDRSGSGEKELAHSTSSGVPIEEVRDDKGATGHSTQEAGARARAADREHL